jgi:hypothetical protein
VNVGVGVGLDVGLAVGVGDNVGVVVAVGGAIGRETTATGVPVNETGLSVRQAAKMAAKMATRTAWIIGADAARRIISETVLPYIFLNREPFHT